MIARLSSWFASAVQLREISISTVAASQTYARRRGSFLKTLGEGKAQPRASVLLGLGLSSHYDDTRQRRRRTYAK